MTTNTIKKPLGIRLVDPSSFYNLEETQQDAYVQRVKRFMAKHPVFVKMNNIVTRKVKAYHNDFFVHDFYTLINHDNNNIFIWITRECGTDLIMLSDDYNESLNSKHWFNAIVINQGIERLNFYIIDKQAETVKKINYDKVNNMINKHMEKLELKKSLQRL